MPLGEFAKVQQESIEKRIYHKNLSRVVYVTGDVAGAKRARCMRFSARKSLDKIQRSGWLSH